FTLLLTGNYKKGWPEYEWRLKTKAHRLRDFHKPVWDGSTLNGKTILVHTEQGFGDTIHFIRYLPMIQAQGRNVIFECLPNLTRLLKNSAGINNIIERAPKPTVKYDTHIPLLSLPGIFGTTLDSIPSGIPYITVNSELIEQWRTRFDKDNGFKVGIVWSGNRHNKKDHIRSCTLTDFAPLMEIPGTSFYSLQKGPASAEANNPPKGLEIINLDNEINDFADTAAAIAYLDLVISVDTAVVHLAGALGKPVWTLLHFAPDWRWLLNRNDSPWYPGMQLFRHTKGNDWTELFEK
ncbi:MAG: glycosyltransferase family 9 protein, partial [Oceanicoccus sp.]|uniref:glycosyltransferase family 9 protein n=1 Tax=Oceanicoccus sp. TaxID=2691044 RepID=UPI00260E3A35